MPSLSKSPFRTNLPKKTPMDPVMVVGSATIAVAVPLTGDTSAGQRSSRLGLGRTRIYGGGETTVRYDHTRERSYATGSGLDSDQLNLNASARRNRRTSSQRDLSSRGSEGGVSPKSPGFRLWAGFPP